MILAQIAFVLSVAVGSYADMGYESPAISLSGGVEVNAARTLWLVSASYFPTDKIVGDVEQYGGDVTGLYRLPAGLLAGVGASYRYLDFRDLNETADDLSPHVVVGWQSDGMRVLGTWHLPGSDDRYESRGASVIVTRDLGKHLRVGAGGGVHETRPRAGDRYDRATVGDLVLGVRF
jgi:hypothetical protein